MFLFLVYNSFWWHAIVAHHAVFSAVFRDQVSMFNNMFLQGSYLFFDSFTAQHLRLCIIILLIDFLE